MTFDVATYQSADDAGRWSLEGQKGNLVCERAARWFLQNAKPIMANHVGGVYRLTIELRSYSWMELMIIQPCAFVYISPLHERRFMYIHEVLESSVPSSQHGGLEARTNSRWLTCAEARILLEEVRRRILRSFDSGI